jgi:pyruvate carboxylase
MTEGIAALVALPRGRDGKILKWYVDKGDRVHRGQRLAMYETDGNRKELKCPAVGTVADVIVQEGGSCKAKYDSGRGCPVVLWLSCFGWIHVGAHG